MRKLSKDELVDGLYVQCREVGTSEISPTLYRLVTENSNLFYTVDDGDWKINIGFDSGIWYETEDTLAMNRQRKIEELGI
jgi:hypothetical protein